MQSSIAAVVDDVRTRGDAALIDALGRFDKIALPVERLRVSADEFEQARAAVSDALVEAMRTSIAQVRAFNEVIVQRSSWMVESRPGLVIGEQATAIPSVGLFVPAGKGSFPSVMIQIATPAVVAGVQRIVVMVPPLPGGTGQVDPATLVAARELGLNEVYRCNGPAGIAALACGTETDDSADPRLLAADLINEAEHGLDSSAVLVGTSRAVLEAARGFVMQQLETLPEPRRTYATTSIARNGGLVLVHSRAQAMDLPNAYAPEHLQLAVTDPEAWLPLVRYAGTVLLGQWTTFAASNFAIGTPATLPTTGYAQVSSGVTASTYLVRVAVAQLDEAEFHRLAPVVTELARHEGFPAHAATVTIRQPDPA
jgi:histidinol dehydrogenase